MVRIILALPTSQKQKNPIEPKDVVKNWMRLKNTLEYLGLWEQLNSRALKCI
jgi:hypothetical protein